MKYCTIIGHTHTNSVKNVRAYINKKVWRLMYSLE
jgi:hypothetical protein